jgi:TRAP-type mannitol/chloroaromatic compound transport system permease small subunit
VASGAAAEWIAGMERIFAFVDGLSTWVARIAALGVIALMLTLTFEVAMRYGLNSPTAWSFDVSYFLNSFFVMMGAAYTLKQNSHVRVDLIYSQLPERLRAGLDAVLMLGLFLPFWSLMLYAMWPNIMQSWRTAERASVGTWQPPIYPFKSWVFLAICLLLLQGIVVATRNAMIALRRQD